MGAHTIRTLIAAGVLAAGAAALPGCLALAAGAAAGVGTYAYVKGEMTNTFEASLDRTHDATLRAMERLGFRVKSASKDAFESRIVAEQADGTDVTIRLNRVGDTLTEAKVRVGTFGNESRSRTIMDAIRENL